MYISLLKERAYFPILINLDIPKIILCDTKALKATLICNT